ncbi:MAG: hypothetical protein V4658_09660 [Bacteroidota bacterium]
MAQPFQQTHLAQEIKLKLVRLIANNEALLKQVQALGMQNEALKSEVQQQKNTIQTLQTQNKMVKLAEMLPQDAVEKQELKKLITANIRQIDDCIRLLSE